MSETASAARGGEFATSRRGGIAEDYDFIMQKALAGVPASAIARMVARPVADVRQVIGLRVQAQKPAATEIVPDPTPHIEASPVAPEVAQQFRKRSQRSRSRDMPPAAREIVRRIAVKHNETVAEVIGRKMNRRMTTIRQECWHALYTCGRGYTLWMIGSWFDGRDHTCVLGGIQAINARLEAKQARSAKQVDDLEAWKRLGRAA